MAEHRSPSPSRADVGAVYARLKSEAVRCGLLGPAGRPDPILETLLQGFAREIAGLQLELERSLDDNRLNLLAHFLGLGYRRQPAQALVAFCMDRPQAVDCLLRLDGALSAEGQSDKVRFSVPGSARLPAIKLAAAAYTGPGGLVLWEPDPKPPVRTEDAPRAFGTYGEPGPPTIHIGLSGTPPASGEILSIAVIPPEETTSILARGGAELVSYRRWLMRAGFMAGSGSLGPPRRLDEVTRQTSIRDAVSSRLPTREAAFRAALERHIHGELLFVWEGPLADRLIAGEPPAILKRAAAELAPDDLEAWGNELRWVSIELPNLPKGDPLRLFKRLAVNTLPVIAYRELRPDRNNINYDEIVPQTGAVSYPLSNELHTVLQRDDWVVDRVECSGEEFPHIQEHPDPEKGWYALVSDSRSSTIFFHVPEERPAHMGSLDLYLGLLVGDEANGARIEPNPYNRVSYPNLRSVVAVTETVGGTGEYEGDIELPWEAIGSFLRTRDRLITRWDYDGFIRRFDPRIAACSFQNVALQRADAFLPGVAITVHFDEQLAVPRADCQVAIALLARELERRAALGTHLEVRLGEPLARLAEVL